MRRLDHARPLTVAVTGLNATANPGPGVAVIRALREAPGVGRIVGLAYDGLDPGIYADGLADDVFLLPYPSQGTDALRQRLAYIRGQVPLDVIVPTLDTELPSFIALEAELADAGVGMLLPSRAQYELRAKNRLAELAGASGLAVPAQRVLHTAEQVLTLHEHVPYPLFVKGLFHGARLVRSTAEALAAFHHALAEWGVPVVAQAAVTGDEVNVVAVGDGAGGTVGALAMRKQVLTREGKAWAGVAIKDPRLLELTHELIGSTRWRGACEIEVLRDTEGRHHLLEINPRFPSWVYLSAGAGMNLPAALVQLAAGRPVAPMHAYTAGTMFVRIALDQLTHVSTFQAIAGGGELTGDACPTTERIA